MPTTSYIKNIEQERAKKAYQFVEDILAKADSNPKNWNEYSSMVKKLPVLIKTNGLGQTLAFIQHRNANIYTQIQEWLKIKKLVPQKGELIKQIIEVDDLYKYRQITIETLSLLTWMKRFVDGLDPEKNKTSQPF